MTKIGPLCYCLIFTGLALQLSKNYSLVPEVWELTEKVPGWFKMEIFHLKSFDLSYMARLVLILSLETCQSRPLTFT